MSVSSVITQQKLDREQIIVDKLAQGELDYKLHEEQDSLIARAIRLMSKKLLDFFEICDRKHIIYDLLTPYTNVNQATWARDMIATFEKLKQWEIKNVGKQQFSKAFEML